MPSITSENSSVKSDAIVLEDFLEFSEFFFKVVCLKVTRCSTSKCFKEKVKILLCDAYFWFSALNSYLFIALGAVTTLQKSSKLSALTASLPLLTSLSMIIVKCLTIYGNKSRICDICDILRRGFPYEKNNTESYLRRSSLFGRIYAVSIILPSFVLTVIPVFELLTNGAWKFPLNISFPFDTQRVDVYLLSYLWTVYGCFNGATLFIATDTFTFSLITLISMEFDTLNDDFERIPKFIEATQLDDELKKLIHRHEELLACTRRLASIFSPSFLCNIVQSSFVLCLTAFQYMTSTEATQFLFYALYCAAMLNQIWLSCYFGQKVINSSERVAHGAYASGWEIMKSLSAKRAIMRVIQRAAQRPARLTAMNFTDISLTSFMTVKYRNATRDSALLRFSAFQILTSAYSYFALLREFNSRS